MTGSAKSQDCPEGGCPQGQAQHCCSISALGHPHTFWFICWPCSLLLYLLPPIPEEVAQHTCIPLGEPWAALLCCCAAVLLCWLAVPGRGRGWGEGEGEGGVWKEMAGLARDSCGPPHPQPRSVHRLSLRPAFLPNILPSPSLSSLLPSFSLIPSFFGNLGPWEALLILGGALLWKIA